ncbi:MAG TPA: arginine repressor [bacterium]|nr:arginine repressor [bacterium]
MPKKNRHFSILRLIESDVESQQDLLDSLLEEGIEVSQSTLSKDLKELGIIKVRAKNGRFRFVQTTERDVFHAGLMLRREIMDFLRDKVRVHNLVVLKTVPGNASGLSKFLDEIGWPEIVGTLASVDTVLAITQSDEDAERVIQRLDEMIAGG